MRLENEEIEKIADLVAVKVAEMLKPLLKGKNEVQGQEQLMDINDLSKYIKRPKHWIYNNKRDIPHIQNGRRGNLFFKKKDIDKWLEENKASF